MCTFSNVVLRGANFGFMVGFAVQAGYDNRQFFVGAYDSVEIIIKDEMILGGDGASVEVKHNGIIIGMIRGSSKINASVTTRVPAWYF